MMANAQSEAIERQGSDTALFSRNTLSLFPIFVLFYVCVWSLYIVYDTTNMIVYNLDYSFTMSLRVIIYSWKKSPGQKKFFGL